jgi:hypothetical protein
MTSNEMRYISDFEATINRTGDLRIGSHWAADSHADIRNLGSYALFSPTPTPQPPTASSWSSSIIHPGAGDGHAAKTRLQDLNLIDGPSLGSAHTVSTCILKSLNSLVPNSHSTPWKTFFSSSPGRMGIQTFYPLTVSRVYAAVITLSKFQPFPLHS